MKYPLSILAISVSVQGCLFGATLLQEDFSQPGELNSQIPEVGAAWSVTGANLFASDGSLNLPSSDGDAKNSFANQSNTTIYAGLSFTVTQSSSLSGSFFFSFLNGTATVGRVFVTSTADSLTFNIGIENDLDNPINWVTELVVGQEYRAVIGFTEDGTDDFSRLWINPVSVGSVSVSDTTESVTASIDGIILRSSDPFPSRATGTAILINDLYVGDVFSSAAGIPEPSVAGLTAVLCAALITVRRR